MSYKTILVQADQSDSTRERVRIAVELATQNNAHLIGAAVTGASRFIAPGGWGGDGAGYSEHLVAYLALLREQARKAIDDFDAAVKNQELRSYEGVILDDEAGSGISQRGRYADLVVIGQTQRGATAPAVPADLPEYVIMSSARPVLVIPFAGTFATLGRGVLVAWDGSASATRAVSGALPLLERAERVDIVVFKGDLGETHGEQAGDDIALYLARHDVKANVIRSESTIDAGVALLSLATDRAADLIVMGGYGHTRFREMLMGGVTRTVLQSMTVPVLMAH